MMHIVHDYKAYFQFMKYTLVTNNQKLSFELFLMYDTKTA